MGRNIDCKEIFSKVVLHWSLAVRLQDDVWRAVRLTFISTVAFVYQDALMKMNLSLRRPLILGEGASHDVYIKTIPYMEQKSTFGDAWKTIYVLFKISLFRKHVC